MMSAGVLQQWNIQKRCTQRSEYEPAQVGQGQQAAAERGKSVIWKTGFLTAMIGTLACGNVTTLIKCTQAAQTYRKLTKGPTRIAASLPEARRENSFVGRKGGGGGGGLWLASFSRNVRICIFIC